MKEVKLFSHLFARLEIIECGDPVFFVYSDQVVLEVLLYAFAQAVLIQGRIELITRREHDWGSGKVL